MPTLTALLWQGFLVALAALVILGIYGWLRQAVAPPVPEVSRGELEELYRRGAIDVHRYLALKDRMGR